MARLDEVVHHPDIEVHREEVDMAQAEGADQMMICTFLEGRIPDLSRRHQGEAEDDHHRTPDRLQEHHQEEEAAHLREARLGGEEGVQVTAPTVATAGAEAGQGAYQGVGEDGEAGDDFNESVLRSCKFGVRRRGCVME